MTAVIIFHIGHIFYIKVAFLDFFLPSTLFCFVGLCFQGEQFGMMETWVLVWIIH